MNIKVGVNGAKGNMGRMLSQLIEKTPGYELACSSSSSSELKNMLKKELDVIVDLTSHNVVYENTRSIIEANIKPVIGTSGLTTEEVLELQKISDGKDLGGVIAPNFSMGAMLMMKCTKLLAKQFENIEIVEMHRQEKTDKVSGTAYQTKELIKKVRTEAFSENDIKEIPIHSVRLPGILARQDVIFGSTGETVTISHNSISRECFMPGILFAITKAMSLTKLVYGLENLLDN